MFTIRVHEPLRDPQDWRQCTHKSDAESWFACAASQFQPDTEIVMMEDGGIIARVVVLTHAPARETEPFRKIVPANPRAAADSLALFKEPEEGTL